MDTPYTKYLLEKLDVVLDSLKSKLKVTFGFVLKNVEDRSCRYYYAHEMITLLEKSNRVANTEDFTKLENFLSNTDIIESRTREPANTKWKFYKLTTVTILVALHKVFFMGCKDTALPDPLLKNHSFNCLTSEEKKLRDVPWQFMSLWSSVVAFDWKWETRGRNFQIIQSILRKKLVELILQTFLVFIWKILQQWRKLLKLFKQINSLPTLILKQTYDWRACEGDWVEIL